MRYIVADRSRKAITLSARLGPGEFTIVRPVPKDFTLAFSAEQSRTFAACLADLVRKGELLIADDAA